jgi:hypothetical protein
MAVRGGVPATCRCHGCTEASATVGSGSGVRPDPRRGRRCSGFGYAHEAGFGGVDVLPIENPVVGSHELT